MAISRKGNVGNEHAPASSPAVAHRRAKRTEWRMRGIEPYKVGAEYSRPPLQTKKVSFTTNLNTRPRWQCTVHVVISSVSREIPCSRNDNNRTRIPKLLVRMGSTPRRRRNPKFLKNASFLRFGGRQWSKKVEKNIKKPLKIS